MAKYYKQDENGWLTEGIKDDYDLKIKSNTEKGSVHFLDIKDNPHYAFCTPTRENFECHLTGAGMAQKFIEAYDEKYGYNNSEFYRDLAAVGIVADMEQFSNENAYYLDKGLNNIYNPLLKAIIEKNRFNIGDTLTAQDISFSIAPLINALIRVGTQEERDLMLKASITPELIQVPSTKRGAKEGDTEELHEQVARIMNNVKARQKRQVDKAIKEAEFLDENNIIIVLTEEKNKNFTGLIANKIAGEKGRPCLVLWSKDNESYSGSARCPIDMDFKQFLLDSGLVEFAAGC